MKWASLFLAAGMTLRLFSDVTLPGIFSDHAVLARLPGTPVFGKADPGEAVSVEFAGQRIETKADAHGNWRVHFDLRKTGEGPHVITVIGKNVVTSNDVLVGEVWLCSGQSNMAFPLKDAESGKSVIESSADPKLRTFCVPFRAESAPVDHVNAVWQIAGPAGSGSFSAVAYLFGRELRNELKCPVGLIQSAVGGSAIESWAAMDDLVGNSDLEAWCRTTYGAYVSYDERMAEYLADFAAWRASCHLKEPAETPPPADAAWEDDVELRSGVNPIGPAVIWYRKKISVPESIEKKGGSYHFFQHRVNALFLIDGKPVARTTPEDEVKGGFVSASFQPGELKAGEHELSIRYWCLYENFETMRIGYPLPGGVSLRDGWQRYIRPVPLTKEQIAKRPERMKAKADNTKVPELLYNGMIFPLKPCGISGCIWYQGCTNTGRPAQYPAAIRGLIRSWRRDFEWDFPFLYCQLANFSEKENDPNVTGWAELREGQDGALSLPRTGRAVLIDCGEAEDIHPVDKATPAHRLAAVALAEAYGRQIPFSGPVFKSMRIEGKQIRIFFDHVEGGLIAGKIPEKYPVEKRKGRWEKLVRNTPQSQLEGFAVAGTDGRFFWADAKIEEDTVVVSSGEVPFPVKVRYARQSNPTCNLYNKAGFPAVPFEK